MSIKYGQKSLINKPHQRLNIRWSTAEWLERPWGDFRVTPPSHPIALFIITIFLHCTSLMYNNDFFLHCTTFTLLQFIEYYTIFTKERCTENNEQNVKEKEKKRKEKLDKKNEKLDKKEAALKEKNQKRETKLKFKLKKKVNPHAAYGNL